MIRPDRFFAMNSENGQECASFISKEECIAYAKFLIERRNLQVHVEKNSKKVWPDESSS